MKHWEHVCPHAGSGRGTHYTVTEHEESLPLGAVQHFAIEPDLVHVRCLDCGETLER